MITVGYEDRFVGLVEQAYTSFNWADFGSLSATENAIPTHRVVYFKYGSQIIWDKRTRLDDVFGSQGGKRIHDVMASYVPEAEEATVHADSGESTDDTADNDTEQSAIDHNQPVVPAHALPQRTTTKPKRVFEKHARITVGGMYVWMDENARRSVGVLVERLSKRQRELILWLQQQ
jgi:hypothetical protein